MGEPIPTAEERVRDLFEYPDRALEDCDRAACAELMVSLLEEHAAAAVKDLTAKVKQLRKVVRHFERRLLLDGAGCAPATSLAGKDLTICRVALGKEAQP